MRYLLSLLLLLLAFPANAAPTIQSDAIPTTGLQPDAYLCTFGAAVVKTIAPVKNTDGSVQLKADVATLGLPVGLYQGVSCIARKAGFLDSVASNKIDVGFGSLSAPVLIIILQ